MLRLVAPPVEVPPLSCWSSSPGLPPAPSCDIGESEKQVFSTVSSEQKHAKNIIFTLLSSMQKSSLSPLSYCQFHLDFQCCNGWVNDWLSILINWKVLQSTWWPPWPGSSCRYHQDIPKYAQNIPKYPQNNPRYRQIMSRFDLLPSRLPGLDPLATAQKSKSIAPARIQQLTNQQYPWSD